MKNKSGITLVALAVTIVVIVILASITGFSINNLVSETHMREFASEMKQLEYLVDQYKTVNNNSIDFAPYEINISNISADFLEQLNGEERTSNTITLYKIDYTKIDAINTRYGNLQNGEDDIYVVSSNTGKVYYPYGAGWEGKTYYSLTPELKNLLGE